LDPLASHIHMFGYAVSLLIVNTPDHDQMIRDGLFLKLKGTRADNLEDTIRPTSRWTARVWVMRYREVCRLKKSETRNISDMLFLGIKTLYFSVCFRLFPAIFASFSFTIAFPCSSKRSNLRS